jgi:hypothetical protein
VDRWWREPARWSVSDARTSRSSWRLRSARRAARAGYHQRGDHGEEGNGGSLGNSSVRHHAAVRGGEVVSSGDGGRYGARPATHLGRLKACRRGWRGAPTTNGQCGLPTLVASMRAWLRRLLTGVVACSDRRPGALTCVRARGVRQHVAWRRRMTWAPDGEGALTSGPGLEEAPLTGGPRTTVFLS